MNKSSKGFVPMLLLVLVLLVGTGYFAYKNYINNGENTLPVGTPVCRVNCPTPTALPKPGSIPGWVVYTDQGGRFSFEYPESWHYQADFGEEISEGLYAITKNEIIASRQKTNRSVNDSHWWPFELFEQKLSEYIDIFEVGGNTGGSYRINSKVHNYFGKTDIVTYEFCNSESMFVRGATIQPGEDCYKRGYIDMGNRGFMYVVAQPMTVEPDFQDEASIYKKILSSFKFSE